MNRNGTIILGVCLILMGGYLLLSEYGLAFSINLSWPWILIVIGAALLIAFFSSKPRYSYLTGGNILIMLGIYFTIVHDFLGARYGYSRYWPGIILAIGAGLLVSGLMSNRQRHLITSGFTMLIIGGALQFFTLQGWHRFGAGSVSVVFGIILVAIGLKLVSDFIIKPKAKA